MDRSQLSLLVFDVLRKNPQTHVHAVENEIRQIATEYDRHDVLILHEIVWDLLVQGILAPGKNSLNLNLPFVHVTEHGAACLDDGRIEAYDPEGYVARLISHVGDDVDPILLEDVREALSCFLAGRFAASMVMLARAAETLLLHLARTLAPTEREQPTPTDLLRSVLQALESIDLSNDVIESATVMVSDVQSILRTVRSSSSAPRPIRADRDAVLARLLLFPEQCRMAHDLMRKAKKTPSSSSDPS